MNLKCAYCKFRYCYKGVKDEERLPDFCPMKSETETIKSITELYREENVGKVYVQSTINEKEGYEVVRGRLIPVRPRILELIEFSEKMNYKRIGVAFCIGLSDEALRISKVLEERGFKVYSVVCKCGAVDKTALGVPEKYKLRPGEFEAGCNPVLQATLLNKAETDLNVIVGLCIGHDILFTKHSKAPVTTLIVKDRFTGHNPLIALFTSYHNRMIRRKEEKY